MEGFFLQRFDERCAVLGELQFDTLDEVMGFARSEYDAMSDWRDCPDDASGESSVGVLSPRLR
jgi:hypothetical protein